MPTTVADRARSFTANVPMVRLLWLLQVALLAAAYYGVGRAGLSVAALTGNVTPIWPPTGLSIAALLVFGYRLWPGVAAGALLVNGLSSVPLLTACGMTVGNTLEALAATYLLVRIAHIHLELDRVRDVVALVLFGAVVATAISATIGVLSLHFGGVIPTSAMRQTWRVWWFGDALGALVITPVLLALRIGRRVVIEQRGVVEAVLLAAATTAGTWLSFGWHFNHPYVVFPLLIWAALRWQLGGAALTTLLISGVAVVGTRSGHDGFAQGATPIQSLWLLDMFLAVVAVTGLVLAALVTQRDLASAHNAKLATDLEVAIERSRQAQALAESEARYRALVDHQPGSGVLLLDHDLRVIAVGGSLFADRGYATEAMEGRPVEEILPADQADYLVPHYRAALAGKPSETFEFVPSDGEHYLVDAVPLDYGSGRVEHVLVAVRDVTQLTLAERERERAESGYQAAFEDAPVGMAQLNFDGAFDRVNPALCALLGYARDELEGQALLTFLHPDDAWEAASSIDALLSGNRASYQGEERYIGASGEPIWVAASAVAVPDVEGSVDHLLIHFLDITDRKNVEHRLERLANHDPLTGLLNRRGLEVELERQANLVKRYGACGALLVLDLDHFKQVNDTLGHTVGDQVIVAMAELLRKTVRESDVVARLGGDEFAVILPEADRADAEAVATKILHAARTELTVPDDNYPRTVTVSIGVAPFSDPTQSGKDVLIAADVSMYDAKQSGRDRFATYSAGATGPTRTRNQLNWVDRINAAMHEDRLALYAQPIINLADGTCRRYELLLRMIDESGNVIAPGSFLGIAERAGLIGRIDRWVIDRAIDLLLDPSVPSDTSLSVNVSALSVGDPALLHRLEERLATAGPDAERLVFEITETTATTNLRRARTFVERLSALGCKFAIDDFGAGFGNFYYLKHLPFDYIKIDGEFVNNCANNKADQLVIASLVSVARGLGKKTIAEFVADEPTVQLLREAGVDYAQGFHFGRPGPVASVLADSRRRAS